MFLGCNDEMTAEYLSKKCGKVTIRVTNASFPMQPLFSPIYNNTRPASESRQSTSRDLMMPDELLSLDNKKCIILLRGQRPLLLDKIIPDEMLDFPKLKPVRVVDHIPEWRRIEEEKQRQRANAEMTISYEDVKSQVKPKPSAPTAEKKGFNNLYEYVSDAKSNPQEDVPQVQEVKPQEVKPRETEPQEPQQNKSDEYKGIPKKVGLIERYEYVPTTPDEIRKSAKKN